MGLIAHPSKITGVGVSSDGKYLLTSGGDDYCVNMWLIDLPALDQNVLFRKFSFNAIYYHVFHRIKYK